MLVITLFFLSTSKKAINGGSTATFESTNTFSSGVTATSGTDTFGMDSNLARRLSKPQQLVSVL